MGSDVKLNKAEAGIDELKDSHGNRGISFFGRRRESSLIIVQPIFNAGYSLDLQEKNILLGLEDDSILADFEETELREPSPRKIVDGRVIYASLHILLEM